METLSIGELARRTGVRPSAIRYYEEAGIIPRPARNGGRRRYDAEAVRRIEVLKFAQQTGFTLREIKTLFQGFASKSQLNARWSALARKKIDELDARLRRIQDMRRALELGLRCGCIRIEDCAITSDSSQESH
jgi:MerR family transcriptional regulator, redox-sensitive transcriptional activator SoxR